MNRKTLALLSVAAVSLASCGHQESTSTTNTTVTNTVTTSDAMPADTANLTGADTMNTSAVAPLPATGQAFANAAAASDAFEIAESKLAATNAHGAAIKAFAKQMITAHTGSTEKLKTITAGTPITPDPTLAADQQARLDALKAKTGADFDAAYAADQVAAHQATLDAVKGYAATGDVPTLKTFASGLVPVVTAHLNMAKGLKP